MPQAIAYVVDYIVEVLVAYGVSATVAAEITAVIVTAAEYAAVSYAANWAAKEFGPSPPVGVARGLEISGSDPLSSSRIVFGFVKLGGVYTIPPISTGANGEIMHIVQCLAGHEVDHYGDVYFGNERVVNANIAAVTGSSGDGLVSGYGQLWDGTTWNATTNWGGNHWVRRYTGTSSQTVDYILNQAYPTAFTSDFRGRGITYAATALKADDNSNRRQLPQLTYEVYGAKCYDPRLDSTNGGSGSQRYATPSTWTYSNNPALCAAWFLINVDLGMGFDPASEIDWPSVAAAATICDTSMSGGNAPPTGAQPRFTCNLVLEAINDPIQNLRAIIDTMVGRFAQIDGIWHIYAAGWASPVSAISYKDFVGPVSIQACTPRTSSGQQTTTRYNGVRVKYIGNDPNHNWQATECYPRANDTYKTADGGERIWKELTIPGCTDEYQAQRIAEFQLRQSRNQIVVTGSLGPKWMSLGLWETCTLTWPDMGWSSKTFRVAAYAVDATGGVQVALVEEQSTDWTDLTTGQYNTPSTSTIPATNPLTPSAPTSLTATGGQGNVTLLWGAPLVTTPGMYYRVTGGGSSSFGSNPVLWSGSATKVTLPFADTSLRWFWVEAVALDGSSSAYPSTGSAGVTGAAIGITAPSGLTTAAFPGALDIYWTDSATKPPGTTYSLMEATGVNTYASAVQVYNGPSQRVVLQKSSPLNYYYWVRGINNDSSVGGAFPATNTYGIPGTPLTLVSVPGTSVTSAANVNITTAKHTPDGFTWQTRIAGFDGFYVPNTGNVYVRFNGVVACANSGGGGLLGQVACSIQNSSTYNGWASDFVQVCNCGQAATIPLNRALTLGPLNPGTYSFGLYATRGNAVDSAQITGFLLAQLV